MEFSANTEQELAQLISRLYRQAVLLESTEEFRTFCYQSLKQKVAFDAGIWVTRRQVQVSFGEAETFVYNLPASFMANYAKVLAEGKLSHDPISERAVKCVNQIVSVNDVFDEGGFYQNPVYLEHAQLFNIEQFAAGWFLDEISQKSNGFSFYRFDVSQPFSDYDKTVLAVVLPHLAQAMSGHLLSKLARVTNRNNAIAAIFDMHGNLLEGTPRFAHEFGNNPILKETLAKTDFSRKSIELDILPGFGLEANQQATFITVRKNTQDEPALSLTERQREVCELLQQGLTDKEIGAEMGISPHTVSNHLKNVYKSLGVDNRLKAIALLNEVCPT